MCVLTNGESKVAMALSKKFSPGLWTNSSEKRLLYKKPISTPQAWSQGVSQCEFLTINVHGLSAPTTSHFH